METSECLWLFHCGVKFRRSLLCSRVTITSVSISNFVLFDLLQTFIRSQRVLQLGIAVIVTLDGTGSSVSEFHRDQLASHSFVETPLISFAGYTERHFGTSTKFSNTWIISQCDEGGDRAPAYMKLCTTPLRWAQRIVQHSSLRVSSRFRVSRVLKYAYR